MQAPKIETQTLPPPPGIIGSLRAGFDVTAGHITAILLPVALDLFLWLGPRLTVNTLGQQFLKFVTDSIPASSKASNPDFPTQMTAAQEFFKSFNLLAILRTFPVGITSVISGKQPGAIPVGAPIIVDITSFLNLIGLIFLITLVGWIFGALYFRWVAALVTPENNPSNGRAVAQTLLYSFLWVALCWTLGLPTVVTLTILFQLNNVVGEIALLILGFISMWLIVPVFFSAHGIFVKKQNVFASIVSSFQLSRFTLPTSSLFIMTIFLLSFGTNLLWSVPTNDSWLTAVGILGHGFITTALLASTFIYYQNMSDWLKTVLERIRAGVPANRV
jgi:hypothetical protein